MDSEITLDFERASFSGIFRIGNDINFNCARAAISFLHCNEVTTDYTPALQSMDVDIDNDGFAEIRLSLNIAISEVYRKMEQIEMDLSDLLYLSIITERNEVKEFKFNQILIKKTIVGESIIDTMDSPEDLDIISPGLYELIKNSVTCILYVKMIA
jgi:hypothetical protein